MENFLSAIFSFIGSLLAFLAGWNIVGSISFLDIAVATICISFAIGTFVGVAKR